MNSRLSLVRLIVILSTTVHLIRREQIVKVLLLAVFANCVATVLVVSELVLAK